MCNVIKMGKPSSCPYRVYRLRSQARCANHAARTQLRQRMDFPSGSGVKNPPANAGDAGWMPGWRRSSGEGNGHPLQYSCLGNPMDRGA